MKIKKILIFVPFSLIAIFFQSFFWVPTYQKQGIGDSKRLVRYIDSAIGDAQILNPILNADTASANICGKVFDGLIDLDDQMRYRPRLAESWEIHEEIYFPVFPDKLMADGRPASAENIINAMKTARGIGMDWARKIRSVEVQQFPETQDSIKVPKLKEDGTPETGQGSSPALVEIPFTITAHKRVKAVLEEVDQDFFQELSGIAGEKYFGDVNYKNFIFPGNPADLPLLEPYFSRIYPIQEHNPVLMFHLRKGVRFHDGHEFDSGDVKFTYEAIMSTKSLSPRTSDFEPVKSMETPDPHTVIITYKRLFSPAINAWFMGILPEHLLNEEALKKEAAGLSEEKRKTFGLRDSAFNQRPIGTGPFKFQEWQSDELIHLVRNQDYWEGPPEYQDYIVRIIPDSLTQEMEFFAGAIDSYSALPHQIARFKKDERFQNFSSLGYGYSYVGYNNRKPIFQDKRIRKALGMAIPVRDIIKYLLYNEGEPISGPFPKNTDWYDQNEVPLEYDPAGAEAVFRELGWSKNSQGYLEKDGKVFEFNLITNNGNDLRKNILTIAQNAWKKIGVKCNTQLFEWAVFLKDFINTGKFDAVVLGWSMGIDPDLYQIWHSSQAGPQQLNFVGYDNPEADALIVKIRQEYDREKQIGLCRQLHRLIAEDQPYTFLYAAKATTALDKKIVIVEKDAAGNESYKKIYPTKDGSIGYYFNKWRKLAL
ncbi:MAG: peptide ABC transporter substrate-binding protein [Nitrospinae bacterium]|nr:peptide ABC transporter substrate-binding protein [Nitrospinota bacterium]